jgi:hypothetical protein
MGRSLIACVFLLHREEACKDVVSVCPSAHFISKTPKLVELHIFAIILQATSYSDVGKLFPYLYGVSKP